MGCGLPRLRRGNYRRGGHHAPGSSSHCDRTWTAWHLCQRRRQRSRHTLWPKASDRNGDAGLHPARSDHWLYRPHILCLGSRAAHGVRHRHLARLIIPHGRDSRYGGAVTAGCNPRSAFHARLRRRIRWANAGGLGARPFWRHVTAWLGALVLLCLYVDGSRACHLLGDPTTRACRRQGQGNVMASKLQPEVQRRRRMDPMVIAVNALGITQITAWGTSFYCLGVLAKPIVADTGWPLTTVFLGFSVALLVMGLISTWVGRLIDRVGARAVMCIGTIIVSIGLVALARARDPVGYLAVWAVIGIGMRCCLYDAAFAALVQVTPSRGRKAISYLTLYGAYASTVFWVLGHYLNAAYGWRGTLIAFAAINLGVCLPLNWLGLARRDPPQAAMTAATTPAPSSDGPVLQGRMRVIGIFLFALIMSLNGFVFGIISIQLVPL